MKLKRFLLRYYPPGDAYRTTFACVLGPCDVRGRSDGVAESTPKKQKRGFGDKNGLLWCCCAAVQIESSGSVGVAGLRPDSLLGLGLQGSS